MKALVTGGAGFIGSNFVLDWIAETGGIVIGFAKAVVAHVSGPGARIPRLSPIDTEEYPAPAKRPKKSVLSNAKLHQMFGLELPPWEIGLRLSLDETAK